MTQIARQNSQAMHLGCGSYRDILKTRLMGTNI
jgi:hypothetical protein